MNITSQNFPTSATMYRRKALVSGARNNEPAVYLQGGWSKGKAYQSNTLLTFEAVAEIRAVATKHGYDGCQVMQGAHFTMNDVPGNVYGCEPGGFGLFLVNDQPLDYVAALTPKSIEAALGVLTEANNLSPLEGEAIRLALSQISRKMTAIQAFQVEDGGDVILTIHKDNIESQVTCQPGDWVVRQANGVVQRIAKDAFAKLGYTPIE